MNICVFCSCSPIDDETLSCVRELGYRLGCAGNSLVFGAFGEGLMGAIADGFQEAGAKIYGVAPKVLVDAGRAVHPGCDRVIKTISLAERKAAMIELSDAIIAAPGGIGTLDEVFSVLAMDITKELDMPVVLYNHDGFFDELMSMLGHMQEDGFIRRPLEGLIESAGSIDAVCELVQKAGTQAAS